MPPQSKDTYNVEHRGGMSENTLRKTWLGKRRRRGALTMGGAQFRSPSRPAPALPVVFDAAPGEKVEVQYKMWNDDRTIFQMKWYEATVRRVEDRAVFVRFKGERKQGPLTMVPRTDLDVIRHA